MRAIEITIKEDYMTVAKMNQSIDGKDAEAGVSGETTQEVFAEIRGALDRLEQLARVLRATNPVALPDVPSVPSVFDDEDGLF